MEERAALRLARKVVRETLRGQWQVRSLGPGSDAFEVTRKAKDKTVKIQTAWNYTHALRSHRDVRTAEPSLTLPGHDLPEHRSEELLTPAEMMAAEARLTGDEPLPCAEGDFAWSLALCQIGNAWALTPKPGGKRFGEGIVVGHPDTGYTEHPQIWPSAPNQRRVKPNKGFDFEDDDTDPEDPLVTGFLKQPGHGTATSSVIMSAQDPVGPSGVSGVAPKATLIPIRVTPTVVLFNFRKLSKAIYHAVDKGAHVISMSLGGPFRSDTLERAVKFAVDRGVIVLAAAGNVWPWVVYPARLNRVIGVGACNCERRPWKKTARGRKVDISAPGEGVWRAGVKTGSPPTFSEGMGYGTSFAVATTAGAAALWLAFHGRAQLLAKYGPAGLVAVFRELLVTEGVVTPSNWNTDKDGAGILNVKRLLEASLPDSPPAAGMMEFQPESPGPFDDVLQYFPEDDPAEIHDAVLATVNTDDRGFGGVMGTVGDELLFHIATNPDFRAGLQRRASRGLSAQAMRAETRGARQSRLRAEMSDQLRRRMGLS